MITKFDKVINLVLFVSFIMSSGVALGQDRSMPSEPGKCYAKCKLPDEFETYDIEFLVYNGGDVEREGVELETIIVSPATTEWDTKKRKDCRSADLNDCMIWYLKEIPAVSYDFYIVKDTSLIKNYYVEVMSCTELVSEGYSEWREVVCQADVTPALYKRIQLALIDFGVGERITPNGKMSRETKEALVKLQKMNNLPVGSFDAETMEFLGLDY